MCAMKLQVCKVDYKKGKIGTGEKVLDKYQIYCWRRYDAGMSDSSNFRSVALL